MYKLGDELVIPEPLHGDPEEVRAKIKTWERDQMHQARHDCAVRAGVPRRIVKLLDAGKLDLDLKPIRETLEAVSRGRTLILLQGLPGTGKSVAACYVLTRSLTGRYVRADRYSEISASYDKLETREQDFVQRSDFLVIDDVGEEPGKDHWRIERLISERYDSESPTIITTNLQPGAFMKAYKERVVSRLGEVGRIINCTEVVRPKGGK